MLKWRGDGEKLQKEGFGNGVRSIGAALAHGSRWDVQQGVVCVCLRPRGGSLHAAGDSKPCIFIAWCAGLCREFADFGFLS